MFKAGELRMWALKGIVHVSNLLCLMQYDATAEHIVNSKEFDAVWFGHKCKRPKNYGLKPFAYNQVKKGHFVMFGKTTEHATPTAKWELGKVVTFIGPVKERTAITIELYEYDRQV